MYDDDRLQRTIDTFEEQIRFANSPDEKLRKQTDLFWENTYIRRLLDGDGKIQSTDSFVCLLCPFLSFFLKWGVEVGALLEFPLSYIFLSDNVRAP